VLHGHGYADMNTTRRDMAKF